MSEQERDQRKDEEETERGETERDLDLPDEQGEEVRGGILPPDEKK